MEGQPCERPKFFVEKNLCNADSPATVKCGVVCVCINGPEKHAPRDKQHTARMGLATSN